MSDSPFNTTSAPALPGVYEVAQLAEAVALGPYAHAYQAALARIAHLEELILEYAQADASYLGLHHDTGPGLAQSKTLAATERALRDEADRIRAARRTS